MRKAGAKSYLTILQTQKHTCTREHTYRYAQQPQEFAVLNEHVLVIQNLGHVLDRGIERFS